MEKSLSFSLLCVGFVFLDSVNSFPIDISSVSEGVSSPLWLTNYFVTGIGFFLIIFSIIFGCVCCRNGKGFKQNDVKVIQEFRNSSGNLAASRPDGFVNPTLNSELTIFPPLGASANEICRFEPLPDIKCQTPNLRPAAFSYTEQEISSQDWFVDPYNNFPRNQLKYVQEYGRGWFGRVVEGEAQNITPEEKVTKVMVKILHEDATPTDHMYFLHEVKFYRDLKHPNILRLLGRCLEMEPFLIILECYSNGDLKTFLSQNLASAQALVEQGVTLKMCYNITSGLQFMHENKFIHTDLAARNCLVGPDLSVKIGDYGNSIEVFKSDYYCAGSVALPVRWCAPETLKCTDITIETREVTPPANIWSLGVVFWEICEFCKLPYSELNDDQVIVRVLGEKNYFLEKPKMICLHKDELYHLMKLCWKPPVQRPTSSQICVILNNLISSAKTAQKEILIDSKQQMSQDFEQRWQNLKPNSIPKKDNAINADESTQIDCSIISSKLKNAKVADSSYVDSPLGMFLSNKGVGQESPRFCLKFDKKAVNKVEKSNVKDESENGDETQFLKEKGKVGPENNSSNIVAEKVEFDYTIEPKIINPFRGAKENDREMDSWLKGVEINNEEDESFVRKISEAIRDLDATLAMEKTSSSEENSGKSSRQNSPGKDVKEKNEPVVDFKLGKDTSSFINFTQKGFEITSLQNTEQPQSLNFTDSFNERKNEENENYGPDSLIIPFIEDPVSKCKRDVLDESLKGDDSLLCSQSRNSSDTDDEVWRRRIEKGEISEKVKEKSKSIANLMILTHIDSDDSDIDFEKPFEKGLNRNSFLRRSGSFAKSSLSSNNFGSENDLTFAVLEDDFKESLKKLNNDHKEHGHFDSLGVILPSSANRENVWENLFKPSVSSKTQIETAQTDVNKTEKDFKDETVNFSPTDFPEDKTQNTNNFLGDVASENHKNKTLFKKEVEGKDQRNDSFLKEESEKSSSKNINEEISVKEYPICDSKTSSTIYSDSEENSSHLKESDSEGSRNKENSNIGEVSIEEVKHSEVEEYLEEKTPYLVEKSISSSAERNVESRNVDSFQPAEERPLQESEDLNSKGEDEKIIEPSRSVLKDNFFIPEITISEEPPEEFIEYENKKFEFKKPNLKAFKFVLKDEEKSNKLDLSSEGFSYFPNDQQFSKKVENDFEKFSFPEENATVIVGACEDFTMDYFKGLKTTSKDLNVKNENFEQNIEEYQSDEENLVIWDKHLEKAFSQQLSKTNFDDISFRSFGMDGSIEQDTEQVSDTKQSNDSDTFNSYSVGSLVDFIESEKLHTEKVEDPIHINRLTSLFVMANEEEYEHFKLRTPDDERSSDSGFRDKGSLSESVEDACEGKYNLEDIEAELEEAFVKGVFGNSEPEKEKDSVKDLKNPNNFEYEESKFYEDGSRNEEDFSDIDGEIEFWHNKDESDYYPMISEFHPACSEGWYLHPPDETMVNYSRNVNEDIVNALRNKLQENLPAQSRGFDEFTDFYEPVVEDPERDLNIHYISDCALPLSPILEEQESSSVVLQKNIKNSLLDGYNASKVKKNIVRLMESVKLVDTNTFMQYLDYMIENEGRDLDDIEETEEEFDEKKESVVSPFLISDKDKDSKNLEDSNKSFVETETENKRNNLPYDVEESLVQYLGPDDPVKVQKVNDDILVVNTKTNEATLVERSKSEFCLTLDDTQGQKDDFLEDNSENNGLGFTSGMSSPDRERSLSEISRSSNGTRSGDALSEITLSSPDLVPDCFSTSGQEMVSNCDTENESNEKTTENKFTFFDNVVASQDLTHENSDLSDPTTKYPPKNESLTDLDKESTREKKVVDTVDINQSGLDFNNGVERNNLYEISTSFMGDDDDDDEDTFWNSKASVQNQASEEQTLDQKNRKDSMTEESDLVDWQSESSEDEEVSSSSGEFIWKLYGKFQNGQSKAEVFAKESNLNKAADEEENIHDEDEEEDNESSTGSSASITDFVPSAWNSQATPSKSALKSPDKKADKRKKNVWFKKQKYHCVYEYPREPSDNEDVEGSPFKESTFEKNVSEAPISHFYYGVNAMELPNKYFPYGISKMIDLSSYTDWDVVEGEDPDLSLTDTDSENGTGKTDTKKSEINFYNLNPFDYDFNTGDMNDGESEFFVSSSSRPFQGGSSSQFLPGNNQALFNNDNSKTENQIILSNVFDSKDFVTPDSGVEDSANVTPLDLNQESVLLNVKNLTNPKTDVINLVENIKGDVISGKKESDDKEIDLESFEENTKPKNGFSNSDHASIPLSNMGLGELRHTKGKLKLDLPRNLNNELGAIINKKSQ